MAKGPKPKTKRKTGDPRATAAALKGLRENLRLVNLCNKSVKELGLLCQMPSGRFEKHPLLETRTKAWSLVLRACAVLGVEAPKPKEAPDEYEEFLARKKKGGRIAG